MLDAVDSRNFSPIQSKMASEKSLSPDTRMSPGDLLVKDSRDFKSRRYQSSRQIAVDSVEDESETSNFFVTGTEGGRAKEAIKSEPNVEIRESAERSVSD